MSEIVYPDLAGLSLIQSRVETNNELIEEYARAMAEDSIAFDPVEAVKDGQGNIYVWDGYHRTQAALKVSYPLAVRVRTGTKSEAEWLALSANQKHGLRRSNADRQQIIRRALLHPNGARLSNLQVARHCGVDDKTVARIRCELEATSEIPKSDTRLGADGRVINTANIGPQPKPPPLRIDQLESAVRLKSPGPEPESTHLETRYCPHCGTPRQIDPSLIKPESSVGISYACDNCGEITRIEAFLLAPIVTPAAFEEGSRELGVGNRGEESSLPTPYSLLPIPFPQGSQYRKVMLQERLGNLAEIIRDCPTDRLYEIEAWFDEIEAAFAALVTAHVTRAEEVWGENVNHNCSNQSRNRK